MKESEEGQEQLYICDHASEKCGKCAHREKHTIAHSCNYSCNEDWGGQVECIPPKEAPKTKRVGVIWFGEVLVDKCENPMLIDEMTGYVYDQVELIDADRLRYGVPEKGDVICDVRGTKLRSTYEPGAFRLIIDPPTPEPQEAVDDVLERMPNPKNYQDPISGVINLRGYYNAMKSCFKDLKAAQEREEKS